MPRAAISVLGLRYLCCRNNAQNPQRVMYIWFRRSSQYWNYSGTSPHDVASKNNRREAPDHPAVYLRRSASATKPKLLE